MPISTPTLFDNTGMRYDPTAIINNGSFDVEKYRVYSPVFLSTNFIISYGLCFASFTAALVHVCSEYIPTVAESFLHISLQSGTGAILPSGSVIRSTMRVIFIHGSCKLTQRSQTGGISSQVSFRPYFCLWPSDASLHNFRSGQQ
jgi:hypothetical protein